MNSITNKHNEIIKHPQNVKNNNRNDYKINKNMIRIRHTWTCETWTMNYKDIKKLEVCEKKI